MPSRPGLTLPAPRARSFQISAAIKNQVRAACLVAGGVGIAALYLLARSLMAQNVRVILFYGARSAEDLVLRDYFERLGIEIQSG
jgi:dihydroorotate dehydrogenase electron transfer subunit